MIVVLVSMAASIAGAACLCIAIVRRGRVEARRELFGLSPGQDPWP